MGKKQLGKCCSTFDQRNGCIAICLYVFIYSAFCLVSIFAGDVRLQSGGYNPHTNKMQVYFGICGVAFAYIGFDGINEDKPNFIRIFNHYQVGKLVVFCIVFIADMYELLKCDKWVSTLESQRHFNPSMESISSQGLCSVARLSYAIGFAIDFWMNVYFTHVVQDYSRKVALEPAYVIAFSNNDCNDDSRHLVMFDEKFGEPAPLLGPENRVTRSVETHGHDYGAATLPHR